MFDANLLFINNAAITTTGNGTSKDLKKTAADGVDVEVVCTALSGSTTGRTLDFILKESDDDSNYFNNVTFPQITTTGRWARRYQSNKRYARLDATVGTGTGASFTITAGIVSGKPTDQVE